MFDPYGKVTVLDGNGTPRTVNESLYGNPWTFTGRRLDGETGLMYYRARMYDTGLGRFIGRDPFGYIQNIYQLYAYCGNNPVALMDPSGRSFWSVVGNFALGVAAGAAVAVVVVVAAPAVAAAGASVLIAAGVSAATATTVASATVTVGLAVTATVGTITTGSDIIASAKADNWDRVAYGAGTLVGAGTVGASGGGRYVGEKIGGSPSSVPPSWNPIKDMSLGYKSNKVDGSVPGWLASGPTPQSGAAVVALTGSGVAVIAGTLAADGDKGWAQCCSASEGGWLNRKHVYPNGFDEMARDPRRENFCKCYCWEVPSGTSCGNSAYRNFHKVDCPR